MQITFQNDEIGAVINALDFYSRIWIGQFDHILWEVRWFANCRELDKKRKRAGKQAFCYQKCHVLRTDELWIPRFSWHFFR